MKINREHIKNTFQEYTDRYDSTDPKIKLKIDHTYRVADLCERIAKSLDLLQEDIDLAWLSGMLHDIGRFGCAVDRSRKVCGGAALRGRADC